MDRSAHPPHAPAPASFAPPAPLSPSSNLTTTVAQPPNPYTIPSQPATQAFAAPFQSAPACPLPAMSQPLSQALNDPSRSTGIPVVTQGGNPEVIQRSDAAPNNQTTTNPYSHQVESLGGPKATAPFLQDFNLVAEAAKRAQMGIVMRDLESVTL